MRVLFSDAPTEPQAVLADAGDKAAFAAMLDEFVALLANQTDIMLAADMEKNGTAMVNSGKAMANHWNGGAQLGDSQDGVHVAHCLPPYLLSGIAAVGARVQWLFRRKRVEVIEGPYDEVITSFSDPRLAAYPCLYSLV